MYPPEEHTDLPESVRAGRAGPRAGARRARARSCRTRSRSRSTRSRSARTGCCVVARAHLGGDRVAEGDPDRQGRPDGARDRHGRARADRGADRPPRAPGPGRARAPGLAPRRGAAGPARDRRERIDPLSRLPCERPRRCCRRGRSGRPRSTTRGTAAAGPAGPLSRPPADMPKTWKSLTAERSVAWNARWIGPDGASPAGAIAKSSWPGGPNAIPASPP